MPTCIEKVFGKEDPCCNCCRCNKPVYKLKRCYNCSQKCPKHKVNKCRISCREPNIYPCSTCCKPECKSKKCTKPLNVYVNLQVPNDCKAKRERSCSSVFDKCFEMFDSCEGIPPPPLPRFGYGCSRPQGPCIPQMPLQVETSPGPSRTTHDHKKTGFFKKKTDVPAPEKYVNFAGPCLSQMPLQIEASSCTTLDHNFIDCKMNACKRACEKYMNKLLCKCDKEEKLASANSNAQILTDINTALVGITGTLQEIQSTLQKQNSCRYNNNQVPSTESARQVQSYEPAIQIQYCEPVLRIPEPSRGVQSFEPPHPIQSTEPAHPVQSTEPAHPVQSKKPSDPKKYNEPVYLTFSSILPKSMPPPPPPPLTPRIRYSSVDDLLWLQSPPIQKFYIKSRPTVNNLSQTLDNLKPLLTSQGTSAIFANNKAAKFTTTEAGVSTPPPLLLPPPPPPMPPLEFPPGMFSKSLSFQDELLNKKLRPKQASLYSMLPMDASTDFTKELKAVLAKRKLHRQGVSLADEMDESSDIENDYTDPEIQINASHNSTLKKYLEPLIEDASDPEED